MPAMKDVTHFETKEAMQRSLMNELDAPCMILVKGSRGHAYGQCRRLSHGKGQRKC